MLNKKHDLRQGKKKTGLKTNRDRRPKNGKDWWKNLSKLIFWCCSFHETKAKKQRKSTKRQKQGNKKKERKRGGKRKKNKREIERERERDTYIYIYKLWCYYLGQVWPFEVLLSGPSFFLQNTVCQKNTIKMGVSALFVLKKKLRAQIWGVIIWAKLVIFKCTCLS